MRFTGERVIEGETPERIWLDHVARYIFATKYAKGKRILDIACGTGYGSRILRKKGADYVIGIDISKEVIEFAAKKYEIANIEFRVGDVVNIDFPDNYFDLVVSFEIIEHIHDAAKCLSELFRVLKPSGLLLISSPNRESTSPGKSFDGRPSNPYHVIEYTKKEFIAILKLNFEILEIYGQRPVSRLLSFSIIRRMLRRLISSLYNPKFGRPNLEKIQPWKKYRYFVVVCRKP